jgi:hypothetical protein
LVRDEAHRYLVEVTDRAPGHDFKIFRRELAAAGAATLTRRPGRDRRFDDIVADKADQLRRTAITADFRVLWVTALNPDDEHILESLLASLYGTAPLWVIDAAAYKRDPLSAAREHQRRECFYYNDAAFIGLADVHAVAFASVKRVCAFINPFAIEAARFHSTKFAEAFRSRHALFDPRDVEGRDDVMFLDVDSNRRPAKEKWNALLTRYGVFVQEPVESEFIARIALPFEDSNGR